MEHSKVETKDEMSVLAQKYIQQAKEEYSTEDYKKALIEVMAMYAIHGSSAISGTQFTNSLIMFFVKEKVVNDTHYVMTTVIRRSISVKITPLSGTIYVTEYMHKPTLALYVGEAKPSELDKEISFFYVFVNDPSERIGLSYWPDITYTQLQTGHFPVAANLRPKETEKLNFPMILETPQAARLRSQILLDNMEKLSDCTLVCKNNEVIKTSRFMLCQNSEYFLNYFTKYSNGLTVLPIQFKKSVVMEYIRFAVSSIVDIDNISEDITECLELGSYLQDTKFVMYVYTVAFDNLENEDEKINLNKSVKPLIPQ
jgi:hypothetical protein